jgi:hypothetical protein
MASNAIGSITDPTGGDSCQHVPAPPFSRPMQGECKAMPQTEAQKRASERNLRKGNPKSYTRSAAERDRVAAEAAGAPPGGAAEPRTIRARAAKPPKAKTRKAGKAAPARPPKAPADPPARSSGGFFGGLMDALRD